MQRERKASAAERKTEEKSGRKNNNLAVSPLLIPFNQQGLRVYLIARACEASFFTRGPL